MPLFRRRATEPQTEWVAVGEEGHRVIPGCRTPGIEQLEGLGDYVEAISARRPPGPDGRDSIAVLNARWTTPTRSTTSSPPWCSHVRSWSSADLLEAALAPPSPPYAAMPKGVATYEYIQQRHQRAVERREWLDNVDSLFRLNSVALLAPYPVAE